MTKKKASFCSETPSVIEAEATICRLSAERFYLLSAAVAQTHDRDWLEKHLPRDGGVQVVDVTTGWGVLVVAGNGVLAAPTSASVR